MQIRDPCPENAVNALLLLLSELVGGGEGHVDLVIALNVQVAQQQEHRRGAKLSRTVPAEATLSFKIELKDFTWKKTELSSPSPDRA